MLNGLAFLFREHVFEEMDYLKTTVPRKGKDFLNYFDSIYVNRKWNS